MKSILLAAFAALVLAACQPGDQNSVVASLVGKKLSNSRASVTLLADGTLGGTFDGRSFDGTWTENSKGEYCRTIPAFNLEGCQQVVPLTNDDGAVIGYEFRDEGASTGNQYFL